MFNINNGAENANLDFTDPTNPLESSEDGGLNLESADELITRLKSKQESGETLLPEDRKEVLIKLKLLRSHQKIVIKGTPSANQLMAEISELTKFVSV